MAELADAGTAGILEEPGGVRAFFDNGNDAFALATLFARYEPALRRERNIDWERVTHEAWPPLPVGERFYLVPPWRTEPAPDGRLRLEVNPGMACGTGWHPCTQLCLEALERYVRPGDVVLDVGAGSGILSLAANLLGARAVGCDIDFAAVAIARERLPGAVFAGSVDAVRERSMDVIVANISSSAIEELAPEFARVRKRDSTVILSGFPESDLPQGFDAKSRAQKQEWVCLVVLSYAWSTSLNSIMRSAHWPA